jgi:ABC-type long-subunit fatty acid transport system fused permease/ATPase subunit
LRRLNLDALLYCVVWALLAILGWRVGGLRLGMLLSAGLFIIVMPASALILSRTGSFKAERVVRWGILAAAAIALFSYSDVQG